VKEKQEKALAGPIAAAVPVKEAPPKPENISGGCRTRIDIEGTVNSSVRAREYLTTARSSV